MIKKIRRKAICKVEGVITVYLSLCLLIIISLVCTLAEGVRINLAKIQARRELNSALRSTLAQYNTELYNMYNLFGLDYGGTESNAQIEQCIRKYLEFMTNNNKDHDLSTVNMLQYVLDTVNITNVTMITDYKGEIFKKQIIEYMKYKAPIEIVEKFLSKMPVIKECAATSDIIQKKITIDEKASELGDNILQLMTEVDGLIFTAEGIPKTKGNQYIVQDYFVKKIQNNLMTKDHLGIHQEMVYQSVKSQCINVESMFRDISQQIYKSMETSYEYWINEKDYQELKEQLKGYETGSIHYEKAQENMLTYTEKLNKMLKEYKEIKNSIQNLLSSIKKISNMLIKNNENAIHIMNEIVSKSSGLEKTISDYEGELEDSKKGLNEEIYKSLKEDLKSLRTSYFSKSSNYGYDNMTNMKSIFNQNIQILKNLSKQSILNNTNMCDELFNKCKEAVYNQGNINTINLGYETSINESIRIIKSYNTAKIEFEYSHIKTGNKESDPRNSLNSLLSFGILPLVIKDTTKVSRKKIIKSELSSQIYSQRKKEVQQEVNFENNKMAKDIMSDSVNSQETISNKTNSLLEEIVAIEYMVEKFKNYTKNLENNNTKTVSHTSDTALDYEVEYILMGEETDDKNLEGIANKLTFIRLGLNMLHILSDKAKMSEISVAATTLVGVTGMPAIIKITEFLILCAWAYSEGIVDTKILLEGGKVPILKNKSNWQLTFKEFITINKKIIFGKKGSNNQSDFGYEDYLRLFLLTQKDSSLGLYRAMDCIEMNLSKYLNYNFKMNQCIFGMTVDEGVGINSIFITLPFVSKTIKSHQNGFKIKVSDTYAY